MRRADEVRELLASRVLVLDGGMATRLQAVGFTREYEALSVAAPDVVLRVHREYLHAGADIITTNTFSAVGAEVTVAAARLARRAADEWRAATPDRPRFVAGTIGPTAPVRDHARALMAGGVDIVLLETIVDVEWAVAALVAVRDEMQRSSLDLPLMVSATVSRDGRLRSGETVSQFYAAIRAGQPFSVGLNCGFGGRALQPFVVELADVAEGHVSCHPNAGLPDASGCYADQPPEFAAVLRELAHAGLIDVVGGCCGTTPAHIAALATAVADVTPRRRP